jgi:uroporphyrinogen decarboxylase
MRQAGRALPEYRALKEKHSFLDLVRTPDLAAEVTLQPVRRFGFDAAILFSDILVVPEALGQPYRFRETGGIAMDFPIRNTADLARLNWEVGLGPLDYVSAALKRIRQALGDQTALIGFAGSPWTLANFMIEGGSTPAFQRAIRWLREDEASLAEFLDRLSAYVAVFLRQQIASGADTVQIFDSLAESLDPADYERASGRWIRQILQALPAHVPVIVFTRGQHWRHWVHSKARVVGLDWTASMTEARNGIPVDQALQGNLNPQLLTGKMEEMERATLELLSCMNGRNGYIFNLGHGVPPGAMIENMAKLVETVRQFAWQNSKSI